MQLPTDLKAISKTIPQEESVPKDERKELRSTVMALLVMALLIGIIVSVTSMIPSAEKVTAIRKEVIRK